MSSSQRLMGRTRRKQRIRAKITGTAERPRLTIFRSLKHIYVQLIDDAQGKTIVSASTREKEHGKSGRNKANAAQLGKRIAERAKAQNLDKVVFDRNGYIYHGVVQAFADSAREAGLKF